ncbi:MAG: prepilin-type N-terminal cleavage/methylation domain-containing protein [Rubrivivax sp.]|nr:prepilin-type N-terminal cleavage/methylation domain-containing protein [Rubrivivax sp.]
MLLPVSPSAEPTPPRHARGLSLIELLIFISVVSIALVALLRVFVQATGSGTDPQLRRQALAVAESLLEEVQLMPFTFCDSEDANVETAASPAGCAGAADAIGPEAGESRGGPPPFDNVNDYNGYSMAGIVDLTNTAVAGLAGYNAIVVVAPAALNTISAGSGDALRITVTVTGPGSTSVTLEGYRSRYAPNASL